MKTMQAMTFRLGTSGTLEDRLAATDNRPSGFDYMRLILAILVIVTHTVCVCYGPAVNLAYWSMPTRAPSAMILPMFFALSGFLVAGSLQRCKTLISFIGLRLFRLIPALAVETTLSAFMLGPIFTAFPLEKYFTGSEFRSYFLNIVGDVHFRLPGVFLDLPWSGIVNQQLWTLPYELVCYAVIAMLALVSVVRRRLLFLVGVVVAELAFFVYHTFLHPVSGHITVGGPALVMSFLVGILLYRFRDRVAWSAPLFFTCLILTLALAASPLTAYLIVFPAGYVTVYLGLTAPKRIKILLSGDYSYGIFLYGFPVQQAVAALMPHYRFWWFNLLVSIPIAWAIAACSWWFVEHPINSRRKIVFKFETSVLTRFNGAFLQAASNK